MSLIKKIRKNGLTLIELIIAMAILSVILTGIYSLFNYGMRTFNIGKSQYYSQADVRLALDSVTQEIRFATNIELKETIDPTTITNDDHYNYIYVKDGSLVYSNYNNGNPRLTKLFGQEIEDSSFFSSNWDGKHQTISVNINSKEGNQEFQLNAKIALPNINLNNAHTTNITSAKAIKYYKNTNIAMVSPPPATPTSSPSEGPPSETPVTPTATPLTVFVKFEFTNQNDYKVYWNGVEVALSHSGNKYTATVQHVFPNTSYTVEIKEKIQGSYVSIRYINPFVVDTEDIVWKIADLLAE